MIFVQINAFIKPRDGEFGRWKILNKIQQFSLIVIHIVKFNDKGIAQYET